VLAIEAGVSAAYLNAAQDHHDGNGGDLLAVDVGVFRHREGAVSGWCIIYLIGMPITFWLMSRLGWMPGTSRMRKLVTITLAVVLWPATLLLFVLSGIDDIGKTQH
jgi:hypothetical protein